MARECASRFDMLNKGGKAGGQITGKGEKGGAQGWGSGGPRGKGVGKGDGKAFSNYGSHFQKGKGKGYQGRCFDCGQLGHKRGEAACWMVPAAIPMDCSVVSKETTKDLSAVEFGGGAVLEVAAMAVEVNDSKSDGSDGWKVAASRKMMRRERNQMLAKDAEVKRKIEKKTKEIQEELEEMMRKGSAFKVVDMKDDAVQIEVDEKLIGNVYTEGNLMMMNFQVAGVKKNFGGRIEDL